MAKIDVKDGYCATPILPEHQKFLKFSLQGKFYKFFSLPNGLCSCPRKCAKLLKPPLAERRLDYVKIAAYIDYALVIARFRVQYGQYFLSFSYFADLFHEPLGQLNKSKI